MPAEDPANAQDSPARENTAAASAASSPESQPYASAANGPKAAKDRQCPFCNQAFTSSSLGRHLDLYIKPKNPKPPDGVHDVEEIRKLRGHITRRQPRSGTKASSSSKNHAHAEDDTPDTSTIAVAHVLNNEPTCLPDHQDVAPALPKEKTAAGPPAPPTSLFSSTSWRATGVINNLPPRDNSTNVAHDRHSASPADQVQRMHEMRRDTLGTRIERPAYEKDGLLKLQEQAEVGRAAELALREVLSSLEAATRRVEPPELFDDVDFFVLSFPGLCLAILPTPPTLFSPTPFPSLESWSLSPPGQKQYENLLRFMHERVKRKQESGLEHFPDSLAFRHHAHLQSAYEHWNTMGEQSRTSAWMLELCRAYARALSQQGRLRKDLEGAQHRVRQLEAEYDRISRCQLPREYLMHPPSTMHTPVAVIRELGTSQPSTAASAANFDVDRLLDKWRNNVKVTNRGAAQYQPHGTVYTMPYEETSSKGGADNSESLQSSYISNGSVWGVNGAMPRGADVLGGSHNPQTYYESIRTPGMVLDEEESSASGAEGRLGQNASSTNTNPPSRSYSPRVSNLNTNGKRPAAAALPGGRIFKDHRTSNGISPRSQ